MVRNIRFNDWEQSPKQSKLVLNHQKTEYLDLSDQKNIEQLPAEKKRFKRMCLFKGKVLIKNVCEHNSMIDETYSKEISKALLGRMDRSKIFSPYLLFTLLFSSYTNRQHQPRGMEAIHQKEWSD